LIKKILDCFIFVVFQGKGLGFTLPVHIKACRF